MVGVTALHGSGGVGVVGCEMCQQVLLLAAYRRAEIMLWSVLYDCVVLFVVPCVSPLMRMCLH